MKIHWWTDSGGNYSCHKNLPGLSAKESLIGYLEKVGGKWYYVLEPNAGRTGPFVDMGTARKALEKMVDGQPMNDWE